MIENKIVKLELKLKSEGKSSCDGVGGNSKTQVEDILPNINGNHELETIHSAEDVAIVRKLT